MNGKIETSISLHGSMGSFKHVAPTEEMPAKAQKVSSSPSNVKAAPRATSSLPWRRPTLSRATPRTPPSCALVIMRTDG